jgi:hypothetical protein
LGIALAGLLTASLFPFSMAFAQHAPPDHSHLSVWVVELSPHASFMMALAFIAGVLAVYLRKSAGARIGLGALAVALPLTSFTQIAVIPVPNTFEDGQPASAAAVNQNFQAVVQQIANHANDMDLHGGGGITSVDGLLGGTISGDVTLENGTLFADRVGARQIGLLNELGDAVLTISSVDGFVAIGVPDTSASVSFSPDGDIKLDGRNTFITGIEGNVVIENEVSGSIVITAMENTTVTTGGTTSITSGGSHDITAGTSATITAANSTTISTGSTASINATRIDLNAP